MTDRTAVIDHGKRSDRDVHGGGHLGEYTDSMPDLAGFSVEIDGGMDQGGPVLGSEQGFQLVGHYQAGSGVTDTQGQAIESIPVVQQPGGVADDVFYAVVR